VNKINKTEKPMSQGCFKYGMETGVKRLTLWVEGKEGKGKGASISALCSTTTEGGKGGGGGGEGGAGVCLVGLKGRTGGRVWVREWRGGGQKRTLFVSVKRTEPWDVNGRRKH